MAATDRNAARAVISAPLLSRADRIDQSVMAGCAVVVLAGPLLHGGQHRAGLPVTQGRQLPRAFRHQVLLVAGKRR